MASHHKAVPVSATGISKPKSGAIDNTTNPLRVVKPMLLVRNGP